MTFDGYLKCCPLPHEFRWFTQYVKPVSTQTGRHLAVRRVVRYTSGPGLRRTPFLVDKTIDRRFPYGTLFESLIV